MVDEVEIVMERHQAVQDAFQTPSGLKKNAKIGRSFRTTGSVK